MFLYFAYHDRIEIFFKKFTGIENDGTKLFIFLEKRK